LGGDRAGRDSDAPHRSQSDEGQFGRRLTETINDDVAHCNFRSPWANKSTNDQLTVSGYVQNPLAAFAHDVVATRRPKASAFNNDYEAYAPKNTMTMQRLLSSAFPKMGRASARRRR
jgi:hypothetical protein